MSKISDPWSNRQQRHLSYISEFTTDIQYVRGEDNSIADVLSRATISEVHLGIDYKEMAKDQLDDEIQAYRTSPSSLQVVDVPFGDDKTTLLCDIYTGQP